MEKKLRDDSRFAHVATDPRYRRVPKAERKVKIDKRFESMFSDKNFKLKYSLDKRGRPISHSTTDNLRRYYDLGSDESEDSDSDDSKSEEEKEGNEKVDAEKSHKKSRKVKISVASSEEGSERDQAQTFEQAQDEELPVDEVQLSEEIKEKIRSKEVDYARGNGVLLSDSSSDEESSENESEVELREIEHDWGELDRDAERTDEVTNRLAVCNMDWDRIRASDLMVLFNSFMPAGGVIYSVTIYPSEFGIERMKQDESAGPAELLGKNPTEPDEFNNEGLPPDDENEEGEKFNNERLRQYQLTRLKYYYAVIVFDSQETANKIYTECDGTEYESSASRLDLRFVPDDTTFDQEPKDTCSQMPDPTAYVPLRFTTSALHQGKVRLTWDETDPYRVEATKRIAAGTAGDDDLQAYIASSSGEEAEEEENVKESTIEVKAAKPSTVASISKYRALLSGLEDEEKAKKDKDVQLQVTWGLDLKKKATRLVNQKLAEGPDGPTPFQQMVERRKEKKRKKREDKKQEKAAEESQGGDDPVISDDDIPSDIDMDDPFFKEENPECMNPEEKRKKERRDKRKERKMERLKKLEEENTDEAKQKKAELELLMMGSEDDRQHFNLKQIMESEEAATKGKKKKKSKWSKDAKPAAEDNFEINVNDNRFSALYTSHLFGIDTSDPKYRKTKAMETLVAEKLRRREATEKEGPQQADEKDSAKLPKEKDEPKPVEKKEEPDQDYQVPAKKAKKSGAMDAELTDLVALLKKKAASKI